MSLFNSLPEVIIQRNTKQLDLSSPQIMGILNVTPDSFSDGGRFTSVSAALKHCEKMVNEGATIIDIGGESTRPNAAPVSTQEELDRVVPIVTALRQSFDKALWLSIDTSKPIVIEAAVAAGADIWNDVRALKQPGALDMAAKLDVPVVLMHMRGEPSTMDTLAHYDNVVSEVMAELQSRVDLAIKSGVKRDNIIVDPGFGFAKSYEHHCQLLRQLADFKALQLPLLFGISRKRFVGEVLERSFIPAWQQHVKEQRDPVSAAAALFAVQQGASIIRTHNVAITSQMLALWQTLSRYQA